MELRQWGDGSEEGSDCGGRSFGVRKRGWVPASARTTGGGTVDLPRLHGGGLCARKTGEVGGGWATVGDAPSRYGRGDWSPHPRGQRGGWIPASVFTGAGSNLPPSRGKGLVGAERAISIVMTCFTKGDGLPPSREKREVGWATAGDAPSKYGRGDGSPHPRGQRGEGRLFFPVFTGGRALRRENGCWCAGDGRPRGSPLRGTEGGTGFRIRGNGGGGGGLGEGPAAGEDFGGGAFQEDFAVTVPVDG